MVGSWATFAASFTEDDPLLLPSPEFDDDDPSSYLLYPPGFGPFADWLVDGGNLPMFSGESTAADPCGSGQEGTDVVVDGGREGAAVNGSGASELLGLSEALSGKVSLMEDCASGCGGKDGVVEYMVIGSLDGSVNGEGDVGLSGTSGAAGGPVWRLETVGSKDDEVGKVPPTIVKAEVKVEDVEESNMRNGGSSESESDGSSSSSSSSSSEESSKEEEHEDASDEDEDDGGKKDRMNEVVDFEEGEIRDLVTEELAMSSDDDEDGGVKGPVRSRNELEVLPPVPPVNASLEPHHRTLPVGIISSVVGTKVIIEGIEKHNPLNEGSILWVTDTRSPLGLVDEIFGPVKNPYYVVRFNSEKEIPDGIGEGTAVSFVVEFANYILNDPALHKRGYDASGENDEEVYDEVEFSDDEKEAEYRRSLRQAKRATDNRRQRDQESHGKNKIQFDKRNYSTKKAGFEKGKDMQCVLHNNKVAPVSQPTNITTQFQPTRHQSLTTGGSSLVGRPPNVRSRITSAPQHAFSSGQVQAPPQPCRFPGQVQAPAQTSRAPEQVQVPCQSSCAPGQIQLPPQPPSILGRLQRPPQQHCVPGQLHALPTPLQQPCIPSQLQGLASPYVLGPPFQAPTLSHFLPGLQAPCHHGNVGGGELTSFGAGYSCLSAPPAVPAIPYGGQLGAPFGLAQQNLLMPQTNALWAAAQQFIRGIPGMFQNNGMPHQQQDLHLFHQNQLFPGFNTGMPLPHHLIPNQEVAPNMMMSWQGSLPNPSVSLPSVAQDGLGQTPSAHTNTGEQGGFALPNSNQSRGQSDTGASQGDIHASVKFNVGNSSPCGRKSYGRGGRGRR